MQSCNIRMFDAGLHERSRSTDWDWIDWQEDQRKREEDLELIVKWDDDDQRRDQERIIEKSNPVKLVHFLNPIHSRPATCSSILLSAVIHLFAILATTYTNDETLHNAWNKWNNIRFGILTSLDMHQFSSLANLNITYQCTQNLLSLRVEQFEAPDHKRGPILHTIAAWPDFASSLIFSQITFAVLSF
jgi:hypothetical protein